MCSKFLDLRSHVGRSNSRYLLLKFLKAIFEELFLQRKHSSRNHFQVSSASKTQTKHNFWLFHKQSQTGPLYLYFSMCKTPKKSNGSGTGVGVHYIDGNQHTPRWRIEEAEEDVPNNAALEDETQDSSDSSLITSRKWEQMK